MSQTELRNLAEQDEDTLKGKYLIFSLGNDMYGMEIRYITEIIGIQPITEVPEMPEYVKGITNLRGKIIPVMDARLRFKKAVREYDDRTCIIVLDTNHTTIGLIVDSVSEVIFMEDEDIAPPPDIHKEGHRYIKGIGKTGGSVKMILDCQKLLMDDEAET
ncbi:MAG: purine-binding chemotaxis protein CheW [Lachnospiraceae bacterium]|nr:purine-binding chemotaxis protein CheW [Lachnospiraceae bacterium]